MKATSENPYYGKTALLSLYRNGSGGKCTTAQLKMLLEAAWKEAENDKEMRKLFFTIIFSFGDITNRQHNIFGKTKVDGGGNGLRETFQYCIEWMKHYIPKQYYKFMWADVVRQFVGLFSIFSLRVKTQKGKKNITSIISTISKDNFDEEAKYIASIIQNTKNPAEMVLIAKWLTRVRKSKRRGLNRKGEKVSRPLQTATMTNMILKERFYKLLSDIMGWEYIEYPHNILFKGMNEWRKAYTGNLESVLFSQRRVVEFDKEEFFKWLNTLPAGARYRVRRRLLDGDDEPKGKWFSNYGKENLGTWFLAWEKFKLEKQDEQRVLTEKVRQGVADEEDIKKLEQVKKEAKVTTGGVDMWGVFKDLSKSISDPTIIQSIMDKVKFDVPVLVVADCSGSMNGLPTIVARFLTTITMLKNPSDEVDNILCTFGTNARIITDKSKGVDRKNRFLTGASIEVSKLIDRTKDFMENFKTISRFISASEGSTNFNSVAVAFKSWLNSLPAEEQHLARETICKYPVIVVVSDGDLNSSYTAADSMREFQHNMLQYFGWNGVVVLWDVVSNGTLRKDKFEELENVVHYYGYNASIINNIFQHIDDLDVVDVYTPLKSLMASNRYELIHNNTL